MGDVVDLKGAAAPAAEQQQQPKGPKNIQELREAYAQLTVGPLKDLMDAFVQMTMPFMGNDNLAHYANNAMDKIHEFTGWVDTICSTVEAMEARAQIREAAALTEKQNQKSE